jgi:CRP/FNR family cyclic AMP-dependent transcriptional regulator
MRSIVAKLRDADRKRIEFGAHDTTGRVAARLVEMAERFGQPAADGVKIGLPFSQDELAGWTGASREAVSKALGVLRSAAEIRTGG